MRAQVPNFTEPDLREVPDEGLLYMVQAILSLPGKVTAQQRRELQQINREVRRREYAQRKACQLEKRELRRAVTKLRKQVIDGK